MNETDEYWTRALRLELADATLAVWAMQNNLSEKKTLTPELEQLAEQLLNRTQVIAGHVARWRLCVDTGGILGKPDADDNRRKP